MTPRLAVKKLCQGIALVLAFPAGALCGFGRLPGVYTIFAHSCAQFPGAPGNFLRAAFYHLTLRRCSLDTNISFGTFFVTPDTVIEPFVSIGSYCVVGSCRIGEWTQVASHVEIISGRHQHARDAEGRLSDAVHGQVTIGARCWIGASAIIMADVGAGSTIGAGAVVVKEIPQSAVAVGNPARVIR